MRAEAPPKAVAPAPLRAGRDWRAVGACGARPVVRYGSDSCPGKFVSWRRSVVGEGGDARIWGRSDLRLECSQLPYLVGVQRQPYWVM